LIPHDFAAHDLVHMALQHREFTRDLLDIGERHDADFGVFQRNGIAVVMVAGDAIKTDDLTGHLKACDLFAAIRA